MTNTDLKALAQQALDAIDDLMGEATGKSVVQDWSRVNQVSLKLRELAQAPDVPATQLKMAGQIDLCDEDEPEGRERVQYGLLLSFPTREAMAEAFDAGICRFGFHLNSAKEAS